MNGHLNNYIAEELKNYDPNKNRAYNQWTRSHDDTCEYANQLQTGTRPMKYYTNQFSSPLGVDPEREYTIIGNQQVYNVGNLYEAPLPSRLNPIYQSYVFPYSTTPNYAQAAVSMMYTDTDSNLRFGTDLRSKKSSAGISEINYNRWDYVSEDTVQNAGQFGGALQANAQGIDRDGFFDHNAQNNVLFANSAWPYTGIGSRNLMRNYMEKSDC